ncbi:hypothetical protein GCM10009646_71110 [Streptomyces aureus]
MAVRPAVSNSQYSLTPTPPGATTPRPVMATRRMVYLAFDGAGYVAAHQPVGTLGVTVDPFVRADHGSETAAGGGSGWEPPRPA